MKRIAILFCVLALLLTACTLPTAPETTQAPTSPGTAQTAEPTELPTQAPTEAPTEPGQTEPVVTESPVTEPPAPGYSAGGSPTAGGVVVYTDPSAYRPYSGPEAKYTRLREGPLDSFEPSDDYGAVYPYAAARLFNSLEDGESWEATERYGLVDASGRILTDGIYSSVKPLTLYDYEFGNNTYLPYWVIEVVDSVQLVTEGLDGEDYTYLDGDTRCGLVSMDGSFLLPMDYRMISVLGDGFLCTREWDGVSFEVYDGSRRFLFTGADLLGDDDYPSVSVSVGGEGLWLIELYGDERDAQCWFCNSRGERVLGPYAEAEAFREGLACVSLDGIWYGYIDVTGAWALEPQFTDLNSFRDGRAIHTAEDSSSFVIDREGKVLFHLEANRWIYRAPCGFHADSGDGEGITCYDRDGNFLTSGSYWLESLDEDTFWDRNYDDEGRIFRLNGPELKFSEVYALSPGMTVLDGKAVEGYLGYGYSEEDNTGHPWFIPRDLSAIYRLDVHGLPTPDTYNTSFTARDQCTNEAWYLCWNGKAWDAVNEAGEVHTIPLRTRSLILRGDRIMALTDRACVYVDWNGKLLFSYPLDDQD